MKRFWLLLIMCMSILMTSCVTETVAVERTDYYDYYVPEYYLHSTPVILVGGVYYYQYFDSSVRRYRRVPVHRNDYRYIHHMSHRHISPTHNHPHHHRQATPNVHRPNDYHGGQKPIRPQHNHRPNNVGTHTPQHNHGAVHHHGNNSGRQRR